MGDDICKCCFIYVNAFGIFVSVLHLLSAVLQESDKGCWYAVSKDLSGTQEQTNFINCIKTESSKLKDNQIDGDALKAAEIFFIMCGLIVYPLGILGALNRNKTVLLAYMGGMTIITIAHMTFLVTSSILMANCGIEKEAYTGCLENRLDNFYENATDSFAVKYFRDWECCSPDGNIEKFWKSIKWHEDPGRTPADYPEVPIQCCKDPYSDLCRGRQSREEDRLTKGCWERYDSVQGSFQSALGVSLILMYGTALVLDLCLIFTAIRWQTEPDVEPAQPGTQQQGQVQQGLQLPANQPGSQGQLIPAHQSAYQSPGRTSHAYQPAYQPRYQPAYQPGYQPAYQPGYPPQGQPSPVYVSAPQGQTQPMYQPQGYTQTQYRPQSPMY